MKVKDCVRLSTVDNFQGEEADVVIVSTVRNNPQGKTGFLQIPNRVNVMMSRAKHGMYVFGGATTIDASREAQVFRAMLSELRKQDAVGPYLPLRCKRHGTDLFVASAADFAKMVPDGGCDQPCGTRLECGHACQRMCHPDDSEHVGFSCRQPCMRLHSPCGHPCANMCFQDCGKCFTKVAVVSFFSFFFFWVILMLIIYIVITNFKGTVFMKQFALYEVGGSGYSNTNFTYYGK